MKASSALSVAMAPARRGNALSCSSMATPPRTPMQGVMSSMWRITFWEGPNTAPLAIMYSSE